MSGEFSDVSRCSALLVDEDRFVRKRALKSIETYLNTKGCQEETVLSLIGGNLANSLNDPVEVNRELSIKVLELFVNVVKDASILLPSLVPVLLVRLGQKDITEHSEEIRYATLNLLYTLVTKVHETSPFLDDYITILQRTFLDPYHEIKKLSCKIAVVLSERKCHRFYQISESIISPMLSNLTHQHSKVRLETVLALEKVLLVSQGKLVDNVISPLTQRLFDSSLAVRQAVIQLIGSWLLDLPDRYSYQTRLLPLLLSGLIDESDDIRSVTVDLWHRIGLKFEKENEEQLKDKLDFDKGAPFSYPYGCKRPILGCRELIYRSASRLFPGLCKDLSDWQEATRLKAASLMPILILHLEESATQHTQHLITGIGNGFADAISRIPATSGSVALINTTPFVSFRSALNATDCSIITDNLDIVAFIAQHANSQVFGSAEVNEAVKIINQLFISTQILGCMISTKFWWHLLEPCLHRCTESVAPSSLAGHLFLLSGLLYGSPLNQLVDKALNSSPSDTTDASVAASAPATGAATAAVAAASNTDDDHDGDNVDCKVNGDTPRDDSHTNNDHENTIINCIQQQGPLHQIIAYLSQNELISVMSIPAKASLLQCVQVCIKRLEEAIALLRQQQHHHQQQRNNQEHQEYTLETTKQSNADNETMKDIIQASHDAAWLLVQNTQIRSWLFEIILGLSSIWPENDSLITSDFGRAIINSCDKLIQQLAACHRDCINLSRQNTLTSSSGDDYEMINTLLTSPATHEDVDRLFYNCMPTLIDRLNEDLKKSMSWHPRSTGLAILSRCLQLAGPALLIKSTPVQQNRTENTGEECLTHVLDLLQRGCRLDCAPGGDKSPGGTDPLTLAAEAEIRLRGLIVLTKLTENSSVRTALASPKYLNYCLSKLILPVCIWRAGRTSEAMRKAAVTSLLAILASAVSINDLSEIVINTRTSNEVEIDKWLCENTSESFNDVIKEVTNNGDISKNNCDDDDDNNLDKPQQQQQHKHRSNLPNLSSSLLSLLLARLGSLLDDDLEGTRSMACLCLTIFFNGLLIPPPLPASEIELCQSRDNNCHSRMCSIPNFLNSSTWIQPVNKNTDYNDNDNARKDHLIPYCPLPDSFGDQVYRFYQNFIKRLNDPKDKIRLLICETINAWIRLIMPMLTSTTTPTTTGTNHADTSVQQHLQLNPVYTAVIEDFLTNVIIHLDDPNSQIRAAVSRVILRVNQFASELVNKALIKARSCHRSSLLCDQLLQFCRTHT
ncbi:unnamed protein product [Trichobilharzia szidati]|nr:unnamed protein product [Trichobilharzia szidati]